MMDQQPNFDFTVQDGFDSIKQTLKNLKSSLQIDKPLSAATVHPLFSLNTLEQRAKVEKSVARIRARLDQWRAWCAADENPTEKQINLKRTTTWLKDRSSDATKINNIRNTINNCQQIALTYLEERAAKNTSIAAPNAMDAATHKKNFINALRMAVSRCKDATWYETQDFDDPTIQVLTIATKAFLIDVKLKENGTLHDVQLELNGEIDAYLSEHFRRALESERISEFERLLHKLADRSREMNNLVAVFPNFNVPSFLASLEHDLASINQHELSRSRPLDTLQQGHGIVKKYVEGPTIFFSMSPSLAAGLSEMEENQVEFLSQRLDPALDDLYSARISLELGPIEGFGMTKDSAILKMTETVEFKPIPEASPENMPQPPVNFMLVLNRPVSVTTAAARRIMKITHGGAVETLGASTSISVSMIEDSKSAANHGAPILSLLAGTGAIPQSSAALEHSPIIMDAYFDIDTESFQGLTATQGKHQRYFYARGPQPAAILIQRIPFVHISQLLPILQILRQQIVNSDLLKSCFNPLVLSSMSKIGMSSRKRKRDLDSKPMMMSDDGTRHGIEVEVSSSIRAADSEIRLMFMLPSSAASDDSAKRSKTASTSSVVSTNAPPDAMVSISIIVDVGGNPHIRLSIANSPDAQLQTVLQTLLEHSHSIPLALLHFLSYIQL